MKNTGKRNFKLGEGCMLMAAALALCALCLAVRWNRTPQEILAAPVSSVYVEETGEDRLDLNLATLEDLMALPGIGQTLAGRILAYREANGGFVHVQQLAQVEGISEGKLDAIRDRVCVSAQ